MARYTREGIDKLRKKARLSEVFEWLGAHVKQGGSPRHRMAWCPFCDDATSRNPGCSINDENGVWHCFVCGRGGDVFAFVEEHEGVTFGESVRMLAEHLGVDVEREDVDPAAESRRLRLLDVLKTASELFCKERGERGFREFVAERKLPKETIEAYGIGFSSKRLARHVIRYLYDHGFDDDDLESSGLCVYSKYDGEMVLRWRERVMFPIKDPSGKVIGFGGRDVTGNPNTGKYINSPECELFHKRNVLFGMDVARREIRRTRSVIICEGFMDVIALQTHGFPQSVAALGTAVSAEALTKLAQQADTIYVSLDADEAGRAAARRVAKEMPQDLDARVRVVCIPRERAKDPDELFRGGATPDVFQGYMDEADDIWMFCVKGIADPISEEIDTAIKGGAGASEIGDLRNRARNEARKFMEPLVTKIPHESRHAAAEWLIGSCRLVATPEEIEREWSSRAREQGIKRAESGRKGLSRAVSSSETRYEDDIIAAAMRSRGALNMIAGEIDDVRDSMTSDVRRRLLGAIMEGRNNGRGDDGITGLLDRPEQLELARILSNPEYDKLDDGGGVALVKQSMHEVRRKAIERQIDAETQSGSPDIMRIISLRAQLSNLH